MADVPALPPYLTQWMGFVLSRVAEMSNALFDAALQPLGISGQHLGVLMILEHRGAQVQARLSDPTRIDKAAMVRLVNDLERAGYVQRLPHPDDKRAVLVHLTDDGRDLLRRAVEVGERVTAQLFGTLTPEEQHTLRQLLTRIAANAG